MNRLVRIEKRDFGLALNDKNPFVVELIKPKAGWRDLAAGNDAFDAKGFRSAQFLQSLLLGSIRQISEEVPLGESLTGAAF